MTSVHFSRIETFDFLCKCLSVGDAYDAELSRLIATGGVDWPAVIRMAGHHLVTPTLTGVLKQKGLFASLDEPCREYLDAIQFLNRERNRTHRQQLHVIARALNEIGVYPLLLKGAATLLSGQYPGAEDRVMGDLDLQLPPDRIDDAAAALADLGYERPAGGVDDLQPPMERGVHHHAPPLLHRTRPVKVELHRRITHAQENEAGLMGSLERQRVAFANGACVDVPDPNTRVLHNFLNAQIGDRLAHKRILNLRQLNEFSRLVTFYRADLDFDAMRPALRPIHHRRFAEYWAQAAHYLDAPYPVSLPRSPNEQRERAVHRLLLSHPGLRRSFDGYLSVAALPSRLLRLVRLTWEYPTYFPKKFRLMARGLRETLRLGGRSGKPTN